MEREKIQSVEWFSSATCWTCFTALPAKFTYFQDIRAQTQFVSASRNEIHNNILSQIRFYYSRIRYLVLSFTVCQIPRQNGNRSCKKVEKFLGQRFLENREKQQSYREYQNIEKLLVLCFLSANKNFLTFMYSWRKNWKCTWIDVTPDETKGDSHSVVHSILFCP